MGVENPFPQNNASLNPEDRVLRKVSTGQYMWGTEPQVEVARKQWKSAMRIYPLRQAFWKVQEAVESVLDKFRSP
ncbi:MAG TPA: hypothetical protein VKC53_03075 [Patescibacteria group bacterium]|nr:hypothetical protein [Patescibacteria group bacterium]